MAVTLIQKLKKRKLILVSASPRRRKLLEEMGFTFTTDTVDTGEAVPAGLPPTEVAEHLAKEKADAYARCLPPDNAIWITADTIVVLENEILNKPGDRKEAIAMLKKLSGKTHQVITGVCIMDKHRHQSFQAVSSVEFKPLGEEEMAYYVDEYAPYDKAGAYGIQEWIGLTGISRIEGSFYNVMGLPTAKLWEALHQFI